MARWHGSIPTGTYARVGRPLFDLGLILCCIPVAIPLCIVIGFINTLVFRNPSLVLFRQERVGRFGQTFWIYKFRTMVEAKADNFDAWSSGEDQLRVTRFGRFLRNTHLDELPQFLNVLRGEMSFIGPRPEMREIEDWANEHIPNFSRRLSIKPGITGLAQITQGYTARSVEAYEQKLFANDDYREQYSLLQDVSILLRTAVWMVRGRGWRSSEPPQDQQKAAA